MKKVLKKNLTRSEKILLIVLGAIIVFKLLYKFILIPQKSKLEALKSQELNYERKIKEINRCFRNEKSIYAEIAELNREKENILLQYFPDLNQAQYIYILNDLLEGPNFEGKEIYFSEPYVEEIDELTLDCMDIVIPYEGNYEGLISILEKLKTSPKKFVVDKLLMNGKQKDMVEGNIALKAYSLGKMPYDDSVVCIDSSLDDDLDIDKENPFEPFESYETNNLEESLEEEKLYTEVESSFYEELQTKELPKSVNNNVDRKKNMKQTTNKIILEDFESEDIYFIPSSLNVKGNVSKSTRSKFGKYSLRFEYNILAVEDENRAYLDLTDRNITIKYPPNSLGLWIYSYSYSPITIGIRFAGQAGEKIDIEIIEGVDWIGWKYINFESPEDLKLYPLQIEKIYIEVSKKREDLGVILLDKLEADYPKVNDHIGTKSYNFYIIRKGDTLESISKQIYGTSSKKQDIMKINELRNDGDLKPGRILVVPN